MATFNLDCHLYYEFPDAGLEETSIASVGFFPTISSFVTPVSTQLCV